MLARRTLVVTVVAMGLMELVDAFFIDVPAAAALFAVLFLGGAVWYSRRRTIAAPTLLALLFAVEIAGVPFYSRAGLGDWIMQISAGLISTIGLIAAVIVIARRR